MKGRPAPYPMVAIDAAATCIESSKSRGEAPGVGLWGTNLRKMALGKGGKVRGVKRGGNAYLGKSSWLHLQRQRGDPADSNLLRIGGPKIGLKDYKGILGVCQKPHNPPPPL